MVVKSWNGTDVIGEVDTFTIFVSINGGSFTPFLEKTRDTQATFHGEGGKTYGFICIATDTAGNVEVKNPVAEVITQVKVPITPFAAFTTKLDLTVGPSASQDVFDMNGTFTLGA